jgi:DmsE family decaheme c-type cytochrome
MKATIAIGLLALALMVSAGSAISSGSAPGPQTAAAKAAAPVPAAPQAGYAGTDTCLVCHADKEESIKSTPHGQASNPRSPAATHGCESCHGPGQAHVDDDAKGHIRKFGEIKPAEMNETCLACHNRGDHAGWEGSMHDRRELSCGTCHSVHSPKSPTRQLVKATQKEIFVTCHRLQVAKTERAVAHMPVREGKMSCSSCHNPHGSISNVKALKVGSSVSESCMTCHAEMRGPMLWEHAPVKENCTTCHDPHGSSNDRMLAVRMPMICQRCHIATKHPASIYDNNAITVNKSNRMFGRSCMNYRRTFTGRTTRPGGSSAR